jgi:hypothetical protein
MKMNPKLSRGYFDSKQSSCGHMERLFHDSTAAIPEVSKEFQIFQFKGQRAVF